MLPKFNGCTISGRKLPLASARDAASLMNEMGLSEAVDAHMAQNSCGLDDALRYMGLLSGCIEVSLKIENKPQ